MSYDTSRQLSQITRYDSFFCDDFLNFFNQDFSKAQSVLQHHLFDFFCVRDGCDTYYRKHHELTAYPIDLIERKQDIVQWLFPLHEPSKNFPFLPTLSPPLVSVLHYHKYNNHVQHPYVFDASNFAKKRMLHASSLYGQFYGFNSVIFAGAVSDWDENDIKKELDEWLAESEKVLKETFFWATPADHNTQRITRIIRSLRFFGLFDVARAFHLFAKHIMDRYSPNEASNISKETVIKYWNMALHDDAWASMIQI